jgi:hypothetical protein
MNEAIRVGYTVHSAAHGFIVGYSDEEGRYGAIEYSADAHLIAAAPDMLEALEEIMKTIAGCQTEFYYQLARAAIAKAKGKA